MISTSGEVTEVLATAVKVYRLGQERKGPQMWSLCAVSVVLFQWLVGCYSGEGES